MFKLLINNISINNRFFGRICRLVCLSRPLYFAFFKVQKYIKNC